MSWNKIDLNSSFRRVEDEKEKLKFNVEDEEGNNLNAEEEGVILNQEEDDDDDVVVETKTKDKAKDKEDDEGSEQKDDADKTRKSRAQERIRQVIKERKEAEAKWQARVEELEQKLSNANKDSLSSQKEFIDARITETKKALSKAQEEGKFEEATEYMSELSDLQTKKVVVDSSVAKQEDEPKKTVKKQEEFDDTELQLWAVKNRDWWQKDAVKTQLAISLAKKIDKEGILTPDTPEYFEELDERVKEIWGDVVEEDEDDTMEKDLQSSSKAEAKTKKPPQTSSGASRTPAAKSNKPVIKLTADEQKMARALGMSNVDWAKQKYRQQKNKDENGYQQIFDN